MTTNYMSGGTILGKKVLYSTVGGTDPIANFRDGSMLHICRIYKPDEVYLMMSQEISNHHRHDDRYRYCLNKLSEMINHKFNIHVIEYREKILNQSETILMKMTYCMLMFHPAHPL